MIVRCFAPICRAGSVCYRQVPESIGVLEALDQPMPVGMASAIGRTDGHALGAGSAARRG
jgi:hypothetical protein